MFFVFIFIVLSFCFNLINNFYFTIRYYTRVHFTANVVSCEVFDGHTIALEILPQVGVLIAIRTNALRLFLESESPRSRRWYVSLATSCSHVLRTAIPGHIGRRGVHVRPHSEDIRCSTPRWYPPGGGGSMADPLRKNTDSSRQGSPPNDGVLVLRFRPIRRFWRIMSKSAFSTIS